MCNPLMIAGVAMTAASMAANAKASSMVAKKRDAAMGAELDRQREYSQQANAVNDTSQGRYKDFSAKQGEKAQNIGDYLSAQIKALPSDAPTETVPTSSNVLVQNERAKQLGKAEEYGSQQNSSLAKMRSFGDLLGGISRDQSVDAANLGTIGGFMRGSNAVLPLELEAANSAGNGWKTAGSLLGMGGQMMTSSGIGGGGPSFASMFGGGASTAGLDPTYAANPSAVSVKPVTRYPLYG